MSWTDNIAALTAAISSRFDFETWTAIPMAQPRHGDPSPDPARPGFVFSGRFDSWPKEVAPPYANSTRPENLRRHGTAKFIVTVFGVADAVGLTNGDRLLRQSTGERFSVQFAQPDGAGNVALYVNQARA